MLKKFALWFVCFGLSFLVSDVFGWTDQGRAFLYIYIGESIIVILALIVLMLIAGVIQRIKFLATTVSIVTIFITIGVVAFLVFATWGATKLFDVDFFVTFQIMTFGQCMCPSTSKKED